MCMLYNMIRHKCACVCVHAIGITCRLPPYHAHRDMADICVRVRVRLTRQAIIWPKKTLPCSDVLTIPVSRVGVVWFGWCLACLSFRYNECGERASNQARTCAIYRTITRLHCVSALGFACNLPPQSMWTRFMRFPRSERAGLSSEQRWAEKLQA